MKHLRKAKLMLALTMSLALTGCTVINAEMMQNAEARFIRVAQIGIKSTVSIRNETHSGAGFIIGQDKVLTTKHILRSHAEDIVVMATGGVRLAAPEYVASDIVSDLAVIHVPTGNLPHASMVDTVEGKVGQFAFVTGNPLGRARRGDASFTFGIIRGFNRKIRTMENADPSTLYDELVEFESNIFPGNSGGPLFDSSGNAMGVVVAATAGTTGYAIPVNNRTRKIIEYLCRKEVVTYGTWGVLLGPAANGVEIKKVMPDSQAARAGVMSGDVVRQYRGYPVVSWKDFAQKLGATPVGEQVPAIILRNGNKIHIVVEVE
jgi:S1-C subfamily serine protease